MIQPANAVRAARRLRNLRSHGKRFIANCHAAVRTHQAAVPRGVAGPNRRAPRRSLPRGADRAPLPCSQRHQCRLYRSGMKIPIASVLRQDPGGGDILIRRCDRNHVFRNHVRSAGCVHRRLGCGAASHERHHRQKSCAFPVAPAQAPGFATDVSTKHFTDRVKHAAQHCLQGDEGGLSIRSRPVGKAH